MRLNDPDAIELAKTIGANMKALREARKEDLDTTAKNLKRHPLHLQRMEAGRVNIHITTLVMLANYFDTTPETLITSAENGQAST